MTTTCAKLKPAQINCAYPPYHLYKVMSPNLAKQAPTVANFIKRFNWTSDDQNQVAYFGILGAVAIAVGALLVVLTPLIRKQMSGVR